jgi:RNA polymerase sigma factor (sigma-70 family)
MSDSHVLLQQYAENQDERAFAELVAQYLDVVYSTALRRCGGDRTLAQDVTQTVFIDFARKARSLQKYAALGGWLYRHTCFTASKLLRSERRRTGREQEAFAMQSINDAEDEEAWRAMYPLLDEGLEGLNERDRDAVVMRFFERHPFRTVGAALNTTEDAARVRVDRALEKLRVFFFRRGVTLSVAALSSVLLERAVEAAPAGLSTSMSATVMAKAGTTTTLALLKATLYANLKTVGIAIGVLLTGAGVVTSLVIRNRSQTTARQAAGPLAPLADNQPDNSVPRLANNHFANRAILGTPGRIARTNNRADTEGDERIQSGLTRWGATLWWKWTAPASGPVVIDTIGSSYDTFLAIYTGTKLNALTVVTENDNASEVGVGVSVVTFNAQRGREYEIQVGGVYTGGGGGTPVRGTVQLNLAMPPLAAISSPLAGRTFAEGNNIVVNTTASSISGVIGKVSLYRGSTLLGSVSNAPYNFTVSNPPPGTNSFYTVATDSIGQVATSAVVRVLVANVGITITSPSDDEIFLNTKRIAISAFPMLTTGSITNVSFFVDEQFIAQDTTAPFKVAWSSVTSGAHRFTARALDDSGNTYNATPVNIGVARSFFPTGSVWKYLDDGSDQGTNWRTANFDDTSWKSGLAELGYGDGNEATRVEDNATPGFNARDTEHYITTYFRRSFVATDIASYASLLMNVKRDDGAVVYLNGREAARFNMNTGVINHLTLARNAGDDGKTFVPATVPASFLVDGTNVVAVEIHQATADSTDISFEMDLAGVPIVSHERTRNVARVENWRADQGIDQMSSIRGQRQNRYE